MKKLLLLLFFLAAFTFKGHSQITIIDKGLYVQVTNGAAVADIYKTEYGAYNFGTSVCLKRRLTLFIPSNQGSVPPIAPYHSVDMCFGFNQVSNPASVSNNDLYNKLIVMFRTATAGVGTVTSFSSGNLSPLFTTSVATSTTTPALSFSLSNAAGGTVFGNNTGSSSAPAFTSTPVLGIPGTTLGTLRFAGNTSGTITLQSAAAAGTWSLTLPANDGDANQVLTTDGTGITSWAAGGSGWALDGNTVGAEKFIGTLDNFAFPIRVNNVEKWRVETFGGLSYAGFGTGGSPATRRNLFINPTVDGYTGAAVTSADGIVAIGAGAGNAITTSLYGVFIGFNAGNQNTTGGNVFIGKSVV